jgi:hypothetical protein
MMEFIFLDEAGQWAELSFPSSIDDILLISLVFNAEIIVGHADRDSIRVGVTTHHWFTNE